METKQLKIRGSCIKELYDNVDELFVKHWEESARNKQVMVLKPDWDNYFNLENSERLVTLAVVDEQDKIVGYSCNIVNKHLHYADLVVAYNDVLFLDKSCRNSSIGLRLIKETEKAVKAAGAKLMLWHAKEDTPLDKILPKMGCKVQEIIYSKEL